MKRIDLTDRKFNRWFVIEYSHTTDIGKAYWKCQCKCGTVKTVCGDSLKAGISKSCGCLQSEQIIARNCLGHPKEVRQKQSIAAKKRLSDPRNHPMFGKKRPDITGEKNPSWNPNLTDEDRLDRRYIPCIKSWRNKVYGRDNYTCQKCGDNKGGNLEAHHIESYRSSPELQTTLSNGITLCEWCHKKFHNLYGYGNNTEEQFNEFKRN